MSKPKAILFIGFRHKVDAVRVAKKFGYQAVLLTRKIASRAEELFDEIFEDDLLKTEVVDRLVLKIHERYDVQGVVSNYEHYVVPRSYLAQRLQVPSTSVYSACCSRNKAMQREALSLLKENIDFRVVHEESDALEAFRELSGDVFVKAVAGIKSRLIFHVRSEGELKRAFTALTSAMNDLDDDLYNDFEFCDFDFEYPSPKRTFLVEKAEYGQQVTVSGFVGQDTIAYAPSVCDIYPASHVGRDDTFLAFRILPSKMPQSVVRKAKSATTNASRILGLQYCSLFAEFIVIDSGDVKLIEMASRMGGYRPAMYEQAYGLYLNEALIRVIAGENIQLKGKKQRYVSMIEIFPQQEGILSSIEGMDEIKKDPSVLNLDVLIPVGERAGFAKHGHTPVLRFMVTGTTYEEVYERSLYYQKAIRPKVK